jgi:hypothetical protein
MKTEDLYALGVIAIVQIGGFLLVTSILGRTALLKDTFLPQLPTGERTFSLAKTQMAFWTLVVLECFLFAVFFNGHALSELILNDKAILLMGISVLTAGGAAAVDVRVDSVEDRVCDALKAVGLRVEGDVQRLRDSKSNPDDAKMLAFFEKTVVQCRTQGIWKDLISDRGGVGLHRLQAAIWTVVLGVTVVWSAWKAGGLFPDLNANLLALLGVSSTGYVGFKLNET